MTVDIRLGDCMDLLKTVPDKSIDMILCDLPYGTTACKWDSTIPLAPLWQEYKRIIKDYRAIVLFGAEPFSTMLRSSNLEWYKYDWIWKKTRALGFTNAKNKPLNDHELISVFSNGTCANRSPRRMVYNPQDLIPYNRKVSGEKRCPADAEGHRFARPSHGEYVQEFTNYPKQVLEFQSEPKPVHPTQKPVPLLEYLIRTYTDIGETVLDNCFGSGSTLIAAVHQHRNFIGFEKEEKYFNIARDRYEKELQCIF